MSRSLLGPSLKALTLLAHHILPQGFSSAEPRCEVKSQVGVPGGRTSSFWGLVSRREASTGRFVGS